ncbi:unnamed protein product [Protopolystoma xenopodis]|uniref:Uncharacterized protein n=1 Tax=Protopolystoma xenopodis TaxID=117903 RepID=A0A448WBI6_9PLAT|nr:unnamed protein product [Protopolystoma xenopodis]
MPVRLRSTSTSTPLGGANENLATSFGWAILQCPFTWRSHQPGKTDQKWIILSGCRANWQASHYILSLVNPRAITGREVSALPIYTLDVRLNTHLHDCHGNFRI